LLHSGQPQKQLQVATTDSWGTRRRTVCHHPERTRWFSDPLY